MKTLSTVYVDYDGGKVVESKEILDSIYRNYTHYEKGWWVEVGGIAYDIVAYSTKKPCQICEIRVLDIVSD